LIALKDEETKGVVLVRYEDGTEKLLPKVTYLRMKKAGRHTRARPNRSQNS
jgi:hypothetical protein